MKAILVDESSTGRNLVWADVPDLLPEPGHVLVDVHATALNRADLAQRAGRYPPPPGASEIMGLEMAGTVASLGEGVDEWSPGDAVCALLPGGGYAEQVSVPASMLMPVPPSLTMAQAAGLPETFLTAYSALFWEGRLEPGETVLIHAGASGVGTSAIQLARLAGSTVFATAGSSGKIALCESLGARLGVNYREESFGERVRSAQDGMGVDLIVDPIGRSHFEGNMGLLNVKGRIVFLATLGGDRIEVDIRELMVRRLTLMGATLRRRSVAEKSALKDEFLQRFGASLAAGDVRPVIDSVFPIERVEEAHERMASNLNLGKIILTVRE